MAVLDVIEEVANNTEDVSLASRVESVRRAEREVELTAKEFEVLQLLKHAINAQFGRMDGIQQQGSRSLEEDDGQSLPRGRGCQKIAHLGCGRLKR